MQSQIQTKCLFSVYIPFTSLLGVLLWSLSHSMAFFTSYLSIWSFSTQLIPASSLFSAFLSNSSSYFDSNDYPHWLKETLSSLTELRSLIGDGSRCQTRSANWLVEKADITDCKVCKACETKPQPLSTVPLPVDICHSASVGVHGLQHLSEGIFCWQTYCWTETYVANLTVPNRNIYKII